MVDGIVNLVTCDKIGKCYSNIIGRDANTS